jgi:hypothetical protein
VGRLVGVGTGDAVAVGTAVGALGVGVAVTGAFVGTGTGVAVPAAPVGTGLGTADGAAGPTTVAVGAVVGVLGVGVGVVALVAPLSAVTALAEAAAELAPRAGLDVAGEEE